MLAERFAKSTATAARRKRTRATMSSDSQRGKASLKPAASAAKKEPDPVDGENRTGDCEASRDPRRDGLLLRFELRQVV